MGNNSYKLILEAGINPASLKKIQDDINKIMGTGGKLGKINLTQNGAGEVTKSVVKYTDAVGNAITVTDKLGKVTQQTSINAKNGFESFTKSMGQSIATTVKYAASVGLLYGALNQIKDAIQYVKDLNKELVNIQVLRVEGASSNEEIAQLATNFNSLAQAMGATTIEVARGSVEWLRQGKTVEQTQELLKSTLMLSKLGALDSAQATEYLTSIMNGFKLETSQATDVVSKLISVDNIAATSAGIIQFA